RARRAEQRLPLAGAQHLELHEAPVVGPAQPARELDRPAGAQAVRGGAEGDRRTHAHDDARARRAAGGAVDEADLARGPVRDAVAEAPDGVRLDDGLLADACARADVTGRDADAGAGDRGPVGVGELAL